MTSIIRMTFLSLSLTMLASLSSCAIVTVNIYFPAEEVRDAYKSLEEELLQSPQDAPAPQKAPEKGKQPPQSLKDYPKKPQLQSRRFIVLKRQFSLSLGTPAWAQGDLSRQIANELRKMPDVVQAYANRRDRLSAVNDMLSQGKVGEGNNGLLAKRGNLAGQDTSVFNAENSDRQLIIRRTAETIAKLNGLELSSENINRLLPQAGEQFAVVRRDEADPGWQIQLQDGSWTTK